MLPVKAGLSSPSCWSELRRHFASWRRARGTLAQGATDLRCRSWLLCKENLNVSWSRDPVCCFRQECLQQRGLRHSSLMKPSIETRATWKGDRPQTLVASCRGIHQFKSNWSGLNIWTRISLGKCCTQRLLIKQDQISKLQGRLSRLQIQNEVRPFSVA